MKGFAAVAAVAEAFPRVTGHEIMSAAEADARQRPVRIAAHRVALDSLVVYRSPVSPSLCPHVIPPVLCRPLAGGSRMPVARGPPRPAAARFRFWT